MTWAQIRNWFTYGHAQMLLSIAQTTWGVHALDVARSTIGWGEEGGNNRGPDIDVLRRGRKLKPWQSGSWCSTAASYWLEEAFARKMGYSQWSWMPREMQRRCPVKRTPGARRLANRIAAAGCIVEEPEAGDFVLWKRKGGAHIGIVSRVGSDFFLSIEGNVGRYNRKTAHGSKVREYKHEFGEPHLLLFVRLP